MKHIIIISAMLLITNLVSGQDISSADVPSVVRNTFKKTFPKSYHIEWEQKGDIYNAEFDINWRDHEVWISNTGAILKYKKEIKARELPLAITAKIRQDFSGYSIDDIDQYEVNKQFYYKVELKKHHGDRTILFDKRGEISNVVL